MIYCYLMGFSFIIVGGRLMRRIKKTSKLSGMALNGQVCIRLLGSAVIFFICYIIQASCLLISIILNNIFVKYFYIIYDIHKLSICLALLSTMLLYKRIIQQKIQTHWRMWAKSSKMWDLNATRKKNYKEIRLKHRRNPTIESIERDYWQQKPKISLAPNQYDLTKLVSNSDYNLNVIPNIDSIDKDVMQTRATQNFSHNILIDNMNSYEHMAKTVNHNDDIHNDTDYADLHAMYDSDDNKEDMIQTMKEDINDTNNNDNNNDTNNDNNIEIQLTNMKNKDDVKYEFKDIEDNDVLPLPTLDNAKNSSTYLMRNDSGSGTVNNKRGSFVKRISATVQSLFNHQPNKSQLGLITDDDRDNMEHSIIINDMQPDYIPNKKHKSFILCSNNNLY